MSSYQIPKEISTELKINKALYLFDLLLLVGLLLIRLFLVNVVHPSLIWWFTLFLILLGVFLIIRPASNPKKRMYEAIYLSFIRKKDTYSAVDYNPDEEDNDEKGGDGNGSL